MKPKICSAGPKGVWAGYAPVHNKKKTLYFNLQYITTIEKSINSFVLLLGRGIKSGFQRLCVFVCYCSTIVTPKKAPFDVISVLGVLVITYRAHLVVISC